MDYITKYMTHANLTGVKSTIILNQPLCMRYGDLAWCLKDIKHVNPQRVQNEDDQVPFSDILDRYGVKNALRCLQCVDGKEKEKRLFACACVRATIPFIVKYANSCSEVKLANTVTSVVAVSEGYAMGTVDKEELLRARNRALHRFSAAYRCADEKLDVYKTAYQAALYMTHYAHDYNPRKYSADEQLRQQEVWKDFEPDFKRFFYIK